MDYSRVNFTSGRMAKIDITANFKSWQYNMLVPQLCAPVWQWFIDACITAGILAKPVMADWTAPRVQQLDPVKETGAQVTKIKAGLATISETIRETGREPEELFDEYKQDVERLKKLGLNVDSIIAATTSFVDNEEPNKGKSTTQDKGVNKETKPNNDSSPDEDVSKSKKPGNDTDLDNNVNKDSDKKVPPAVEYGVGGTQAFIEMILNEQLTDTQKINIGVVWFGLTKEQAEQMLRK
jgi:hypothetical protein